MSSAVAVPDLSEYLARLTPAQERHLRLVIDNDRELPPLTDETAMVDEDRQDRPGLRSLIGALHDAPADLRSNSNRYLQERAARHGIVRA